MFPELKQFVFLVTFITLFASERETWAARLRSAKLAVGLEHALPRVGQPCRLSLTTSTPDRLSQANIVSVTFQITRGGPPERSYELPAEIKREHRGVATSQGEFATAQWKPQGAGVFRISASVTLRDEDGKHQRIAVAPIEGFVTTRELHFNYWQARPEQRFVTSVMDNSETNTAATEWRRRGARPLDWKSGQWHWARGYGSPEKMAAHWTKRSRDRDGIVIDEFGGGDPVDQQLGTALNLARTRMPTMFIAPYCLSVKGPQMIGGLRQANLVLVETYTSDWRWDGFITGRWQTAADAGLTKKSIAVLGLGSQWIGTEKELRRVFRMVRATCPEMPGIGFFPDVPRRLIRAVDSAIEDYFLRPVVEVQVKGNRFHVRNIGESPATQVELHFQNRDGKRLSESNRIASLKPWATVTGDLPQGATTAEIQPAPDRFTTLSYTPPLKLAKRDAGQQSASLQFRRVVLNGANSNPWKEHPKLTLVRTQDNHVRSGFISIPDTNGSAVALCFDVRPDRCWFYGHNSVSLVGEGELTLTWARQDHDAGLEGNQPRPTLIFKGKDEYTVRDVPTMGFRENEPCHILLAYDGHESVRTIVTDKQNTVLWDSGPIPAKGGLRCNKIRFDVNPFKRSEISVDPANATVFLRGGNGDSDSPYTLESTISNFRLVVPERK